MCALGKAKSNWHGIYITRYIYTGIHEKQPRNFTFTELLKQTNEALVFQISALYRDISNCLRQPIIHLQTHCFCANKTTPLLLLSFLSISSLHLQGATSSQRLVTWQLVSSVLLTSRRIKSSPSAIFSAALAMKRPGLPLQMRLSSQMKTWVYFSTLYIGAFADSSCFQNSCFHSSMIWPSPPSASRGHA